jgi:RHS repeat-associated protein
VDDVTPGNPAGIRELARHWTEQGQAADDAASTLGSAKADIEGGTLRLKGDFAPKIRDAIGDLPGELRKLARGYAGCGRALATYATRLAEAQQQSRRARDDWDLASQQKRNAEYDLDQLAPGWDAHAQSPTGLRAHLASQPEPVLTAVTRRENAQQDVDLATTLSRQAAALRGDAERQCVRDVKDALADSGLQNRKWYQKVGDFLKESFTTWDGFVKLCENVALVLGVVALFLSGPLALIVGAILLVAAVVVIADKVKKFADGELGWKDLAFELGMVVLARFGGRALGPAFRRLTNSKAVRGLTAQARQGADRLANRLKLGDRARNLADRAKCITTGHPVDVATGKVFTSATDLDLAAPLRLAFERVWFSTSTYTGPLGHGWHHGLDAALYATGDALLYRTPDGRVVDLMPLYPGISYFDRSERLTVTRDESGYRLQDADGVTRCFAPLAAGPAAEGLEAGPFEPADEPVVVHVLRDVVSRAGHRISLSYGDDGRLVEVVDSGGRELRLEHDEQHRISALTAPHPDLDGERFTVARYGYDRTGNLISAIDPLGHELRYEYEGHLLVRETDRTGLTFHFEYDGTDERARCVHTWGDGGLYERHLTYEPALTTVTDSLGHITRHEYEHGLVVRTVDPLGAQSRVEYEYQQPVQEIDALGQVTSYKYDYRGNPALTTNPDGATVETQFDERDLPIVAVDELGGQWGWSYDDAGLLREKRDPLDRRWVLGYHSGLLASVTDPAGGRTALDYDEFGALVAVTNPAGAVGRWRNDRLSRPVAEIDPYGNERRFDYDLAGRVTRVAEPDGNVRRLSYTGEGDLVSAVDGQVDVRFSYQGLGRPVSRTQAGTTVRFEYDTEEQFVALFNEQGQVYRFDHDPAGRLISERGFDRMLRLYERDPAGRVTSVRRASGRISRYRYDAADRVIAVDHSDGVSERYGYQLDGRLAVAERGTSRVRFERDPLGRVTREIQGEHWVASEYDARGARTRIRSSLGSDQVIERDAVGDVIAVTAGDFEARFTRDALGRELARDLPGGVRGRWDRDQVGRPVRHRVHGASGAARDRVHEWDVDERLRAVTDAASGPIRYQHDGFGQLMSATQPDGRVQLRMPDALGNLFRRRERDDRDYGPAGRVESADVNGRRVRHDYDPDGQLVAKRLADGQSWGYRWAADGSLEEVTRPDGETVSFQYDALGRRVTKRYAGRTTHWVWDGDVPLHEWVDAPQLPASPPITWLFEPESYSPLGKLSGQRWDSIVTDHLGSPVAMFDPAGALTWSGESTIWAGPKARFGDASACPFRWPGQYEDAETGLYYNRFRYYDPEAGHYLSPDPTGLAGGNALYAYVVDPLTWIDPQGLAGEKVYRITPEFINYAQRTINKSFDTPDGKIAISKAVSLGRSQVGKFPPIRVQRVGGILVARDGNSRLYIAEMTGAKKIKVIFEDDPTAQQDLRNRLRRNRLPACGTRGMPSPR